MTLLLMLIIALILLLLLIIIILILMLLIIIIGRIGYLGRHHDSRMCHIADARMPGSARGFSESIVIIVMINTIATISMYY